jgi:putative inorganic carbon (hco3(-)) transporter
MDAALALIIAAPAVAALAAPSARVRAWAMLAALVLVAVVVPARVLEGADARTLSDHAAVVAAAGVGALVLAIALARVFGRHPAWLAISAVAVVPFRIPIAAGHGMAAVLAPLLVVIAAGTLAYAVPRLGPQDDDADERAPGTLDRVLAAVLGLFAVQAAYSPDPARALGALALALVPFALLFVVLSHLPWTPRLARACLVALAGVAVVLVGAAGLEALARQRLVDPDIVAATRFDDVARAGSAFFDPGLFGRHLAVVAVLVAAGVLWTRRPRAVAAGAAVLAALWGGLALADSRTSFAALLAGLVVLAAVRFGVRRTALLALPVLVVVAGLAVAAPTRDALRLHRVADVAGHRGEDLRAGAELFAARPVGGAGSGALAHELRAREGLSWPSAIAATRTTPVTVGAEQGVLGLAALLALLATAGWALLRDARAGPLRAGLAAAFAVLVAHSLGRGALLEDPLTWSVLAVTAALAVAPARIPAPTRARAPEPVHA